MSDWTRGEVIRRVSSGRAYCGLGHLSPWHGKTCILL